MMFEQEVLSRKSRQVLTALTEILTEALDAHESMAFVYGSYAYGIEGDTSDVDVLIVSDAYDSSSLQELIKLIVEFHREWGLALDDEVPFERKLVATFEDMTLASSGKFLLGDDGEARLSRVVKTKEFLESEELRLRLLLNAITGRTIQLVGDRQTLLQLQMDARSLWLKLLPELVSLSDEWTIPEFVRKLIGRGRVSGELFLGFKDHPVINSYLNKVFLEVVGYDKCRERPSDPVVAT
ncbi:MAG: nucleotidyltransferase domain-containing protein [Acidimicrobiaceae bacterium]|nr:nucleotidyltransferase domain-containing protein [Acidimicrobiaceae bacterium]